MFDRSSNVLGYIESVAVHDGRLQVHGWALSSLVGLSNAEQNVEVVPSLPRDDVSRKYGASYTRLPGFQLDMPMGMSRTIFWAEHGGQNYVFSLPGITKWDLMRMRLTQLGPFLRDCFGIVPPAIHWLVHRDMQSIARIKTHLGLDSVPVTTQLNVAAFAATTAAGEDSEATLASALPGDQIIIIVPVYNGFDLLPELFDRIVAHTDLPWQLVVIEDCSSDVRVRPWLRGWLHGLDACLQDHVVLIENDQNVGFIRSTNQGLEVAIRLGGHAVLLNTDAIVPAGWASRLLRPMLASSNVASVTPMSNDAEIFNVPVICQRINLQPGQVDAINAMCSDVLGEGEVVEVPTGVGFCMAMNIEYLRALPELDTAFGKGYGEEVDWCQRARQRGGRNLGLGGLFVEHHSGVSFGSEEKHRLMRRNGLLVSRRYPNYDNQVQEFINKDPLLSSRLAMGIAWAASRDGAQVIVYLVHSMGGGAEHYVARRALDDVAAGNVAIMLRVGGMSRWQIELQSLAGTTRGETNDSDLVRRLLNIPQQKTVVYSCGVGDRNPIQIPSLLLSLAARGGDRVEILFHDYFPISPSYTLLDKAGAYHGVPDAQHNADPAHSWQGAGGHRVSLAEWRVAWGRLLDRADSVQVFSKDSRNLVQQAYPMLTNRIILTPHVLLHDVPPIPIKRRSREAPVIGVLGNIGLQKGAAILRDMSTHLARDKRARLVVIGNVDPTYPLAAPAQVHGNYHVADIPGLVSRYGIDRWLIPSIWPETFSYTTHEVLATRLPVWSFDLGAQGEVVAKAARERGQGGTISLPESSADVLNLLDQILMDLQPA